MLKYRSFLGRALQYFHVLGASMTQSQRGEVMFKFVESNLRSLDGESCRLKLLLAATDGASNMTGRYKVAVKRIEGEFFSGFFRIMQNNSL